jgi:hypothetical protein
MTTTFMFLAAAGFWLAGYLVGEVKGQEKYERIERGEL